MKKMLFSLLIALMSVTAFSQEHLTFNGVPINGTLEEFVQKLESKGFKLVEYMGSNAVMKGDFAGNSATLFILGSKKTKTVWKVAAQFADKDSWSDLKSQYNSYKDMYTQKYGKPSDHFEFFSKPYYEGDGYELQALRKGKCNYISFYNIANGTICVELSKSECLQLGYEDKINTGIAREEKNTTVMEDI